MREPDMNCERCGNECDRDEVHNGICMIYGPWGCYRCGWSEDPRYDLQSVEQPVNGRLDQFGGFTPK